EHDRPRPRRLDHQLHDEGGLAPLARPVPGGEVLLEGDPLDPLEGLEDLRRVAERIGHGVSPCPSLFRLAPSPDQRICSAGLRPPHHARFRSPNSPSSLGSPSAAPPPAIHIRSARLRLRLTQLFIFARLAFGCASPSYSYSLGSPPAAPRPAIHIRSA